MDDTLYDEVDYCRSGFGAVAEFIAKSQPAVTVGRVFDVFWDEFQAGNRTRTFNTALEKLHINYDVALIKELVTVYRNHKPQITLPPDSKAVLSELQGKYSLALLTDGFLPAQQLKVQALGIEKYFGCIIYTEQLGRQHWKPSTLGFEKITQQLEVDANQCVYVADNELKDFIAPNKLGFFTVQLIRDGRIHTDSNDAEHAKAQYIIKNLSELPDLLKKL